MRFCFFALGCKVNLFESEALAQLAAARGHELVSCGADVCVLNSCTVTASSDQKNIRAIHRLRRENPDAVLAVCGCMAQMEPDKLDGLADLVCGTSDRAAVLDRCEQYVLGLAASAPVPGPAFERLPSGVPRGRTRALLKIQDGCDNYCAYCIIPYARGHSRSLPAGEAVQQAQRLAAQGVHEIVLTGIEVSSYGRDQGELDLTGLLDALCRAVPDTRIRLGSLEPRTIDARFCALAVHANLMPHFHLSLQSGCDRVLRRMKRRYTTAQFAENVRALRAAFPDCAVTTDLIVGFPGETEDDFRQTLDFLQACAFADVHVFPYSPRPGTPAAAMDGQVSQADKQARAARAKEVAAPMRDTYIKRFVGKRLRVLLEHTDRDGLWCGHGPYSFQVRAQLPDGRKNALHDLVGTQVRDGALYAVPAGNG